jgi:hypothetical protein
MTNRERAAWLVGSPRRILACLGTFFVIGVFVTNIAIGPGHYHYPPHATKVLLGAFVIAGVTMLAVALVWFLADVWQENHPQTGPSRYHKPGRRKD